VFYNTSFGARIKSWSSNTGAVWDVLYDNLEMHFVKTAIELTQFYKPSSNPDANNTITNINITNVVAYNTTDATFNFNCSDNHPCVNIILSNITSYDPEKLKRYVLDCVSFHATVKHINPPINGTEAGELNCKPTDPAYDQYFEEVVASIKRDQSRETTDVLKADDANRRRVNLVSY